MGNKVSLNVGCCRRGHLFKLKIDTSDELKDHPGQETQPNSSLVRNHSKNGAKGF